MKRNLWILLGAALLLAACGARALSSSDVEQPAYGMGGGESYAQEAPLAPMLAPAPTMVVMDLVVDDDDSARASAANAVERMVIRNADVAVVVKDPEKTMEAIGKMAGEMGGFIVSSNLYQSYTPGGLPVPEATITIRVPAEKLEEALKQVKDGAVEVQNETVSGQDVTSQYVDLESQLKNLEDAEKQLTEIMKKAEKTEEVLEVFNQLTSIRGQIEIIKGQMKYYEESAALSAISVRLIAEETIEPIEAFGWKPKGTLRDAVQDLVYFWQDFVDFLIVLVVNFLPKVLTILLVFGLPTWLIVRAVRNARKRKAAAPAPPQETK